MCYGWRGWRCFGGVGGCTPSPWLAGRLHNFHIDPASLSGHLLCALDTLLPLFIRHSWYDSFLPVPRAWSRDFIVLSGLEVIASIDN